MLVLFFFSGEYSLDVVVKSIDLNNFCEVNFFRIKVNRFKCLNVSIYLKFKTSKLSSVLSRKKMLLVLELVLLSLTFY